MARGKVNLDGKDPDELIASATKLVEAAEYAGATPEQSFVELAFRLDPEANLLRSKSWQKYIQKQWV